MLSSMSKARGSGCKAFPAAPFPTGPLAVMSAGLAREVFERCEYMQVRGQPAELPCIKGSVGLGKGVVGLGEGVVLPP